METAPLKGKKVASAVANEGVEQVELTGPWEAVQDAGGEPVLVSLDALVLPGGVANPDALRMDGTAVAFIKAFFDADLPVAAICHAPWTLIEAGVVSGRTLTSWPSLKTDIENAGGTWQDEEVVRDGGLVTSRKPDDLPAFNEALITLFSGARGTSAQSPDQV